MARRPAIGPGDMVVRVCQRHLRAAVICHTDFDEQAYLESQPNLLKAIRSSDNLFSWSQQPESHPPASRGLEGSTPPPPPPPHVTKTTRGIVQIG